MKRRNLLKSCLIAAPIGLVIGFFAPIRKTESSSDGGGSSSPSICPSCPHEGTLKTEVYADDELILSYNRGLTDEEANLILDRNFDRDITFKAFGWSEY